MPRPTRQAGFTLVELLVSLFAMSLVAILSWQGLDGMVRAQRVTQERADEVQAVQVGLAQWTADLEGLVQLPQLAALDWNGRVLRLTRSAPAAQGEAVVVVGWSRRTVGGTGRWMRWQSPPAATRGEVEQAWARADAWAQAQAGTSGAGEVTITELTDWQVFYFRADAWTNPLSSDAVSASTATPAGTAAGAAAALNRPAAGASAPGNRPVPVTRTPQLPDGVRIVLSLPPGRAITGTLTRDWVRPTVGGGKQS